MAVSAMRMCCPQLLHLTYTSKFSSFLPSSSLFRGAVLLQLEEEEEEEESLLSLPPATRTGRILRLVFEEEEEEEEEEEDGCSCRAFREA